jgi:hypothetical protein
MLGLLMLAGGTARAQSQPIIPGEALIHFTAGSDGEKALRRSALTTPPDLASLTELVNALGNRVGVPLRPGRLSSGDWLVVRVPSVELRRRTVERLARCRGIARATAEPGDSAALVARVTFRDQSPEARILARSEDPAGRRQLDSLVARIARRIDVPLTGVVTGNDLLLSIALDSLTLRLVERLGREPDIETAQPNFRVHGFGPRPT